MENKAKILVVEDERIVAEDIQSSLGKLGYAVSAVVSSGKAALREAEKIRPDLVLMDIVLHGDMNGIETADQIRSRFNIPVVYLTAYADEKTLEKAKKTEPYGYILKPFEDRELYSIIEMVLYKHRMEQKLKDSEAFNFALFQYNPIETIVVNPEGKVINFNLAKKKSNNILPKIGDVMYKDFEGDYDIDMYSEMMKCIKSGELREFPEHRYKNKIFNIRISPFPSGAIITTMDNTMRERAEEALRRSEERYRGLFETMAQGVIYCGNNKKIIACNPAAEKIMDMSRDKMLELTPTDPSWQTVKDDGSSFPSDEHPIVISLRTGKSVSDIVLGIVTPKGERRWLLMDTTPVFNPGEKNPESVFATFTDITLRKEVELALLNRNVQLQSLNAISGAVSGTLDLKVIMDTALKEAIGLAEFSGGVMFLFNEKQTSPELHVYRGISPQVVEFFSELHSKHSLYKQSLLMGKTKRFSIDELFEDIQQDIEVVNSMESVSTCLVVPVMERRRVVGSLNLFENKLHNLAEMDLDFFSSIGTHIGLAMGNAHLYEKTRQTLDKLRIAQDKLIQSEKLAVLGGLTSNVVHEIGNPLGAIMNSVEVLKSRIPLEGRMKELMDIIGWETERLNRTVDQLREFSKPRRLKYHESDLRNVIKRAIDVLNQDFDLVWGRKIITKFPEDFPLVRVDPDAMEQVAINLIKNSLQVIKEGSFVIVRLKVSKEAGKNQINLIVKDDGPGMLKEDLKRIFEPYFSTKARGMGLGMHVVKQIVESHGGTIQVESCAGKGMIVTVLIPIK